MSVPNPFGLAFRIILWPINRLFMFGLGRFMRWERGWKGLIDWQRANGVPEHIIHSQETNRLMAITPGVVVVIPEDSIVEQSRIEQAAKPDEAKT